MPAYSYSDAAVRRIAAMMITPRHVAMDLAARRAANDEALAWENMIVADAAGAMRPAGGIVEGRREIIRNEVRRIVGGLASGNRPCLTVND